MTYLVEMVARKSYCGSTTADGMHNINVHCLMVATFNANVGVCAFWVYHELSLSIGIYFLLLLLPYNANSCVRGAYVKLNILFVFCPSFE